jgi:hypothetical protein
MPAGAGPGGGFLFSTVGTNAADASAAFTRALDAFSGGLDSSATRLEYSVRAATTAATEKITTAIHDHGFPKRRGGTCLSGLGRRLLIALPPSLDIRLRPGHVVVRKTVDSQWLT